MLHLYAPYHVRTRSGEFDVVVDDIAHAVPFWSPKFTKKPVTALVHHLHQDVLDIASPPLVREFIKASERTISRTYSHVVAVSETTANDLTQRIGVDSSKISVIYYGVDHESFKPGSKSERPTVVWVGRMKKYKNVDQIVRAFSSVKEEVGDARLLLAGSGPDEQRIRTLVARLGLKDVSFLGWVTGQERVHLMQSSWCVVYASFTEGWGLGVLEAAACGTPAVVYGAGALREAVIDGKTGLIAPYGDAEALARRLGRVLSDDGLRKWLSQNAYGNSLSYDWDKCAHFTETFLDNLIR